MTTCAECGATSVLESAFERVCPGCQPSGTPGISLWWLLLIVPFFGLVIWKAPTIPFENIEPPHVFQVLGWMLVLPIVHEFTHAVAGWGLGGTVHRIQIGHGRDDVFAFKVGGTEIAFTSWLPDSGLCFVSLPWPAPAWRWILIVAAPAVLHALLAVASWGSAFAFANGIFLVFSLIPFWPSDARLVWWALSGKQSPLDRAYAHAYYGRRRDAWEDVHRVAKAQGQQEYQLAAAGILERWDEVLALIDDVTAAEDVTSEDTRRGVLPGPRGRIYRRASALVGADRLDEALAELEDAYAAESDEAARAIWADGIALVLTFLQREPERARELSVWSFARLPWIPYIAGLHALLAAPEPLPALDAAASYDRTGAYRPMFHGLRTLAQARAGDHEAARRGLSGLHAPWPAVRRLIEAELTRHEETVR